jgi:kynurenine formamidase
LNWSRRYLGSLSTPSARRSAPRRSTASTWRNGRYSCARGGRVIGVWIGTASPATLILTAEAADALVGAAPALVGIDSVNIDGTHTGERPVHSTLLAAEIPIVEHLTRLDALPAEGFEFFAVPQRVEGMGTFPVRAFAIMH